MSKYTTELRYICQSYAEDTDDIDTTIDKAIPHIFNSWYSMDDKEHLKELERKILRHYYTQEIGFETVGLWKLKLNTTLGEIMPKYNILYTNLKNIKDKLFETADFTEDSTGNNTNSAKSESHTNSNVNSTTEDTTHAVGETTGKNTGNSTTENNGSSTTNGNSSNKSDDNTTAWSEYNDTPQGSLQPIESGTYLTNATRNRSDSVGNTSGTSTSDTTTIANQNTTDTENTVSNSDSTTTTNGKTNTQSNDGTTTQNGSEGNYTSLRHVKGKNSGASYIQEYMDLMNKYNDVDIMVINDLQGLFMGLWE